MSPAEDLMDEPHVASQPVVLLVEDEVLIRLAKERGAPDNVTVVLAHLQ